MALFHISKHEGHLFHPLPPLLFVSILRSLCLLLLLQSPRAILVRLLSPNLIFLLFRFSVSFPIWQSAFFAMRIRASKTAPLSSISDLAPSMAASSDPASRCEGLDLLVLAVIEVFGERAMDVERVGSNGVGEEEKRDVNRRVESCSKRKASKRPSEIPSRFHDSVMQPWKRSTRRRVVKEKGTNWARRWGFATAFSTRLYRIDRLRRDWVENGWNNLYYLNFLLFWSNLRNVGVPHFSFRLLQSELIYI